MYLFLGSGNLVQGNFIGTDANGSAALGNFGEGLRIEESLTNTIGGNMELAPPVIDGAGASVWGHTAPKCYPCTVDVFSDGDGQGRIYHGSVSTNNDSTGSWTYIGATNGPDLTATVTDADGNTSEFSAPYSLPVGGVAEYPQLESNVSSSHGSGSSAFPLAGLTAGGAIFLVAAGGWFGIRRLRGN